MQAKWGDVTICIDKMLMEFLKTNWSNVARLIILGFSFHLISIPGFRGLIVVFLIPVLSKVPKCVDPYIIILRGSKGVLLSLWVAFVTFLKFRTASGSIFSESIEM